ncbi:MAG: [acyl-carrier-protein] S-malonyltransferase [Phototrophicales bacterium]|nr:MAG: [acyl-carrier-protein] S-malonyltransferase [Phototrophicales bacterium]
MIDWQKTAFLFPGQGSQQVGMGKAIAEAFSAAKAIFDEADRVFDVPFSRLLFEGPEDELNMTYNTQPALFVTSIAVLAALKSVYGEDIQPAMVAGHSLGEITSLVVAEAIRFEDGLRLVRERARLMGVAGEKSPGAMAAILGLEVETLTQICQEASEKVGRPVVVANDNCPGQIVISGDRAALEHALELCKAAGARRVLPLAVSVAAHSPLMAESAQQFRETILAATPIHPPKIPVIGNANADFLPTPEIIRHELGIQITSPVRWTETMQLMLKHGISTFLEIGSKSVLCGLLKRIDRNAVCIVIEKPEDIHQLSTIS